MASNNENNENGIGHLRALVPWLMMMMMVVVVVLLMHVCALVLVL